MTKSVRPTAKDALIDAAFDVFNKDPSASLADVAERAGVGRATLHRHFASRDDLFRSLAMIAIEETNTATEAACADVESYTDAFQNMLRALIPLGDRYGFLSRIQMEDDQDIEAAYDTQMAETRAMVDEAKKEGLFDPNVPTEWITQSFEYLLYLGWESVRAGETTHTQAADLAWRTLTQGLGPGLGEELRKDRT